MVAIPNCSDDNDERTKCDNVVIGPCRETVKRYVDDAGDSHENIPQVSLTAMSAEDDDRHSTTSSIQSSSEKDTSSESPSVCCRSLSQPMQSKLSVVTTTHDEDDEGIVENEVRHQSSENSLVDDMEEGHKDDETILPILAPPPPPPPPPPPQSSSRHHSHQPHKFYLRQSIPPAVPTQRVPLRRMNRISLHIYDLISSDALMQLPWGCVCEIGKCFNEVNSALHELGTGAYHVGIECNGIEYAYGACSQPNKTGVFSCIPKLSPGYQYRSSIDFGYVPLIRSSWVILPTTKENDPSCDSPRSVASASSNNFQYQEEFVDGRLVIKEMAAEYMGIDYDILKRNCCSFAADACVRLGVPEEDVPTWFRNLAETGAYSHTNFVEPLQHVLSGVSSQQPNCGSTSSSSSYSSPLYSPSKQYKNNCNDEYVHNSSQQQYNMHINGSSNNNYRRDDNDNGEPGFEVIAQRNASNTRDVVVVIDATAATTTAYDTFAHRSFRAYRKSVTTLAY